MKAIKYLAGILLVLVLFAAVWVGLLFFPQPFFDKKLEMGNLALYADRASRSALEDEAREAIERISGIEGLEPGYRIAVFVCGSPRRYSFFAKLARVPPESQGFGLYYAGKVFISESGLRASAGKAIRHSRFEGSLAHVIAHEAAHFVHVRKLGFKASQALPVWKSEGFADWAATRQPRSRAPEDDFPSRLDILFDDGCWAPGENHLRQILSWQLLAEFHFDIVGRTQDEFFDPSLDEAQLWSEMSFWRRTAGES